MQKLDASFFINNRSKLFSLMIPGSVAVISAAQQMPRNGDNYYPFRQSSDFYYLTGIQQQGALLVLYPTANVGQYQEVLFIDDMNEHNERWNGPGLNISQAREVSGVEDIRYKGDIKYLFDNIFPECNAVYFGTEGNNGEDFRNINERKIKIEFSYLIKNKEEHLLRPLMTRLRMIKDKAEVEIIKSAIEFTGIAFRKVLSQLKPGMKEYEVLALINFEFNKIDIFTHAFDPIVASGKNALILHYTKNNGICKSGDLLLLDFGAEWNLYAADISRTIPVNGKYSLRQRALYEATLEVLKRSMMLMRPGVLLADFNDEVGKIWESEHVKLGFYPAVESGNYNDGKPLWKEYCWHGISHSIGLDVHDPFDNGFSFQPGMVLSCEPGIYIPGEETGIRLENDILITDDAPVNLSDCIPIEPEEIEDLMNSSN